MRNKISVHGVKKIISLSAILLVTVIFSGCAMLDGKKDESDEAVINPFSVDSMVDTYDNSKEKINDAVEMENENINKALEESGLK